MTHPRPEDPVIARAVLLRKRLLAGAGRLEHLADRLLEEAEVLKTEAAAQQGGIDHGDTSG